MIQKPEAFELPEGKEVGDTIEALVVLRIDEGDYLTPVEIDGVPIPEPEVDEEAPPAPSMGEAIMEGLV